ncbi:hypothetical protein HK104_004083, partial [Borealophlyctis nickersoniae]
MSVHPHPQSAYYAPNQGQPPVMTVYHQQGSPQTSHQILVPSPNHQQQAQQQQQPQQHHSQQQHQQQQQQQHQQAGPYASAVQMPGGGPAGSHSLSNPMGPGGIGPAGMGGPSPLANVAMGPTGLGGPGGMGGPSMAPNGMGATPIGAHAAYGYPGVAVAHDGSPYGSPMGSPMGSPVFGRRSRTISEAGPFFRPTHQLHHVYSMDRTRSYALRLHPKIERGFFLAEGDWTCYRRNYFQVSSTFSATDALGQRVEVPCLLEYEDRLRTITGFLIGVAARTSTGARDIDLVQHTAKRDKGPQITPTPQPCEPQDTSATRHEADSFHSVTYDRLQFKTATANNGKRRAAQQYHILSIELFGRCEDGTILRIASCESAPLVVRGRAPGHYAQIAKNASPNAVGQGHYDSSEFATPDPSG